MKKLLILAASLILFVSNAFASDFTPPVMTLTGPEVIQYSFDGSELKIPVTVTGTNAGTLLLVFTKGKGEEIGAVTNGYLGHHYVNNIDTCLYVSPLYDLSIGTTDIIWNGKDADLGVVPAGEYTYYLWAFDNIGTKDLVTSSFSHPHVWGDFIEYDEAGQPMDRPVFQQSGYRWVVGSDPTDSTLLETTEVTVPEDFSRGGMWPVQPDDHSIIYVSAHNNDTSTGALYKYSWVPGGKALKDDSFEVTWGQAAGHHVTASSDGNYIYCTCNTYILPEALAEVFVVDYEERELLGIIDITEWFVEPRAYELGAQLNGGPGTNSEENGLIYLGCHCSCRKVVIDPLQFFEDEERVVKFCNFNGDYVFDLNFEETATLPWVCNDYNSGPYGYNFSADDMGFCASSCYDVGAISFGLLAPDGTGIGYFAYCGETAGWKRTHIFMDYNSAYDGIYCDNRQAGGSSYQEGGWQENMWTQGMYFLAHDSFQGIITNGVGVEESAPAAFTVVQNTPNPFNPITTINFSLAEAGRVIVEIYNVTGQKVDTILDDFLDSGGHSVVWNASGFSTGVYFYTVKNSNFSKTMKMTLLK